MNTATKCPGEIRARLRLSVVPVVLVSCIVLGPGHCASPAQDNAPTASQPSDVRLRGTVVDAGGQPIGGARVILVAPVSTFSTYGWPENMVPRATVEADTTPAGEFSLSFARDDTRFLADGDFVLVVRHADYQLRFARFRPTRLLSDWPMRLSLVKVQAVRLRLVDADGLALPATHVAVAEQGETTIPQAVMQAVCGVTDEQGWVTLLGADPAHLQSIYAQSETLGVQKLTATATGSDQFLAQSLPVTSLPGQFALDSEGPATGMDQLEIVVCSQQQIDRSSEARDYSWARATVDAEGRFAIPAISEGTLRYLVHYPAGFPYRPVGDEFTKETRVSVSAAATPWTIHLGQAVRFQGTVLEQESGAPVANMLIRAYVRELSYVFSDERGAWSFWLAPGSGRDVVTIPTLGRFAATGRNELRVVAMAESGEQQVGPLYLRRASSARGTVVNQRGSPVAGAVVLCEWRMGGEWYATELHSGSDGSFRLSGVADGDTIRLSARSADMATERPANFVVSSTVKPELVLLPQTAAQLFGQVVDHGGAPVAGATVTVKKKVVIREEGGMPEFSQAENLLPDGSFVRTDAQGRFCFPPSIDWQHTFRIQIARHGYIPFCTPWVDGRQRSIEDGRIQFNDCCLLHLPETTQTAVSVVDAETGEPLSGVNVIFLGARTGKAAGVTDQQASLLLQVRNGHQIVALEKDGYQCLFRGLASVDTASRFAMHRRAADTAVPRDSVTRFTIPELQNLGRTLLDSVPAPRGGATTINRCLSYFRGLAVVAPADAMRILSTPDANLPSQETLLAYCVGDIVEVDPQYAARLAGAVTDQWYRCFHWISLARQESDLDVRTEYVSEALVAARQLAGDRYLTTMANVAMLLWELGESTEARDVAREAWDRSPELQALVASGERNDRVPVSPSFTAAWGLVDPEAAMTLVALTARPEQVKFYQTEVLLLVADSNHEAFDRLISQFGYANLQVDYIGRILDSHAVRNIAAVASIVRQLPESMSKAVILTILARQAHARSDDAAPGLCREALQTLNQLVLSHAEDDVRSDYSVCIPASVRNVAIACPDLVPTFLFASMQLWSDQRGDGDDFARISALASAVARYDPGLARDLLEPCFEELSWLYDETRNYFTYTRCSPVQAALRSDPDWAVEVVRGICAAGLAESDMHRTELVCGAIDELRAMIVDLHRHEKTIR